MGKFWITFNELENCRWVSGTLPGPSVDLGSTPKYVPIFPYRISLDLYPGFNLISHQLLLVSSLVRRILLGSTDKKKRLNEMCLS